SVKTYQNILQQNGVRHASLKLYILIDQQKNVFASDLTILTMPAEPQKPSLYERLGGIYSISCVVDDLIDRVMTDARLNANPAVNEAHHKVPPPGFKYLV